MRWIILAVRALSATAAISGMLAYLYLTVAMPFQAAVRVMGYYQAVMVGVHIYGGIILLISFVALSVWAWTYDK